MAHADDKLSEREELLAEQARLMGVRNGLHPAIGRNGVAQAQRGSGETADPAEARDIVEERLEDVRRQLNGQAT